MLFFLHSQTWGKELFSLYDYKIKTTLSVKEKKMLIYDFLSWCQFSLQCVIFYVGVSYLRY